MALSFVLRKRGSIDGSAFRIVEVTHVGLASSSITAGSMDLHHIEAIIGTNTNVPAGGTLASALVAVLGVSIAADNRSIVWSASTVAGTQFVSLIGW